MTNSKTLFNLIFTVFINFILLSSNAFAFNVAKTESMTNTDTYGCDSSVLIRSLAESDKTQLVDNTKLTIDQDKHFNKPLFVTGNSSVLISSAELSINGTLFVLNNASVTIEEDSILNVSPSNILDNEFLFWIYAMDFASIHFKSGSIFSFPSNEDYFMQSCGSAEITFDNTHFEPIMEEIPDSVSSRQQSEGKEHLVPIDLSGYASLQANGILNSEEAEDLVIGIAQRQQTDVSIKSPTNDTDNSAFQAEPSNVQFQILYEIPQGSTNEEHPLHIAPSHRIAEQTVEYEYQDDNDNTILTTFIGAHVNITRTIVSIGKQAQVTLDNDAAFDILLEEDRDDFILEDLQEGIISDTMEFGDRKIIAADNNMIFGWHLRLTSSFGASINNSQLCSFKATNSHVSLLNITVQEHDNIPWIMSMRNTFDEVKFSAMKSDVSMESESYIVSNSITVVEGRLTLDSSSHLCDKNTENMKDNQIRYITVENGGGLVLLSSKSKCLSNHQFDITAKNEGYILQSFITSPSTGSEYTGENTISGWANVYTEDPNLESELVVDYEIRNDTEPQDKDDEEFSIHFPLTVISDTSSFSTPKEEDLITTANQLFCGKWYFSTQIEMTNPTRDDAWTIFIDEGTFEQVKPNCGSDPDPQPEESSSSNNSGTRGWIIVFSVVGGIFTLGVICGTGFYALRAYRRQLDTQHSYTVLDEE
eukprot:gb/GECH01010582.1/.p1 GENE.gb/GECH01010582.1/~~gb/GECH01010582.1/.p1  ORF type:complete len:703 (+),score=178.16 gb/GECH01010582.1/:1-2109(+)